jgi:hypothetical protein
MQEVEKIFEEPIEEEPVFLERKVVTGTKAVLILFVPFWIESVHELLKRII